MPDQITNNINFSQTAQYALDHIDLVLVHFLPGGKIQGREYVVLNPKRIDNRLGSFKINTNTGAWSDFATGDKGGDLISLVAYTNNCGQAKAAEKISQLLRFPPNKASYSQLKTIKNRQRSDGWCPINPIPKNVPCRLEAHPTLGKPSMIWTYHDEDHQPIFYIYRFETHDGKQFRPLTYCQNKNTGQLNWKWLGLPPPLPLYNLDKLIANPTQPVLIVEGEKSVDAAEQLFPDYVVTTSPYGAGSAKHANWFVLKERRVLIWPDNDNAGKKYCNKVKTYCIAARAKVSILNIEKFASQPGVPDQ